MIVHSPSSNGKNDDLNLKKDRITCKCFQTLKLDCRQIVRLLVVRNSPHVSSNSNGARPFLKFKRSSPFFVARPNHHISFNSQAIKIVLFKKKNYKSDKNTT